MKRTSRSSRTSQQYQTLQTPAIEVVKAQKQVDSETRRADDTNNRTKQVKQEQQNEVLNEETISSQKRLKPKNASKRLSKHVATT